MTKHIAIKAKHDAISRRRSGMPRGHTKLHVQSTPRTKRRVAVPIARKRGRAYQARYSKDVRKRGKGRQPVRKSKRGRKPVPAQVSIPQSPAFIVFDMLNVEPKKKKLHDTPRVGDEAPLRTTKRSRKQKKGKK